MYNNDVPKRITELMKERNWSRYKLSQISGITDSTLSSMYKKNNNPSLVTLSRLCDAFDVTLSQFFATDDDTIVTLTRSEKEYLEQLNRLNHYNQGILKNMVVVLEEAQNSKKLPKT